jgi:hypothetical protein
MTKHISTFHEFPDTAKAAGYATYNNGPHLAVDVPDGHSTVTCRTSAGHLVTFAFVAERHSATPYGVDIHDHTSPDLNKKGRARPQEVACFGPGTTPFRSKRDDADPVTVTCVIFDDPPDGDRG